MNDKLLRQVIGGVVLLLVLVIVIRWFNGRGAPTPTEGTASPAVGSETRVYDIEPSPPAQDAATPAAASPAKREIALAGPAEPATASSEAQSASESAAMETPPANLPPQPADSKGKYVVQVGSYTNRSYADALVKELTTAGYPVLVEEAAMEGRKIYRVRIGPYGETIARAMSTQLNEKLKQPAAVMRR